jgi:hypothetical protein
MQPIKTTEFGLAEHRFQQFCAITSGSVTALDMCDPERWVHVAAQCRPGDIIWVDADDYSYTAMLKVTYSAGTRMRLKLIMFKDLEIVDADQEEADNAPYFIKLMGIKKWCIIERSTAEVKIELIPTKTDAYKALDDYTRALAA